MPSNGTSFPPVGGSVARLQGECRLRTFVSCVCLSAARGFFLIYKRRKFEMTYVTVKNAFVSAETLSSAFGVDADRGSPNENMQITPSFCRHKVTASSCACVRVHA